MSITVSDQGNPGYVKDPENLWQYIHVIDLQIRNPVVGLHPYAIEDWLKRDLWTRKEAHYLLAGYDPSSPAWKEPSDMGYLDGTTELRLRYSGVRNQRYEQCKRDFERLKEYSKGTDFDEKKSPTEWIAWAVSKGFTHYWGSLVCPVDALEPLSTATANLAPLSEGSPKQIKKRHRRDAIALVIDEVVAKMTSEGVRVTATTVMNALKVLGNADDRIENATDGSGGVIWTRGSGDGATLSVSRLEKRLSKAGYLQTL